MCAEPPGQMTDEKLHAVAAQGKFGNKQIKNSSHPEPFWELKLLKTCTALYGVVARNNLEFKSTSHKP